METDLPEADPAHRKELAFLTGDPPDKLSEVGADPFSTLARGLALQRAAILFFPCF